MHTVPGALLNDSYLDEQESKPPLEDIGAPTLLLVSGTEDQFPLKPISKNA